VVTISGTERGDRMALPLLRRNHDEDRARPAPALPARLDTRRELEELRDRLDRVMESIWQPAGGALESGLGWSPAVDVEEADDAWIVEAELPGIKEKDITLELHGTELSISGDIEERKRRGILRRTSRRVGHFDYRVNLPGVSDTEDVQATLDQGVLTVRVPKPEHAKRRRIEIHRG
jgi:HSP20 family protein